LAGVFEVRIPGRHSDAGPGREGPFNSLILHARPVSVPAASIRFTHTFGLGGISLVLVGLLFFSGLLMMFAYEPSPQRAYLSIVAMQDEILFGRLVRGMHYWAANLLVAVVALHMLRVFLTGGFHGARRVNWLVGLGLLLLVLGSAFTGYLLPWDQISYWAVTICAAMLGHVPLIGPGLQRLLLGGAEIGPATMINFYAVHITLVPALLAGLMIWHFWHVRRAGGVVTPAVNPGKSQHGDMVAFNPHLLQREATIAAVVVALVLVLAIFAGAPLGEPANPGLSPNPAKAPWYFLGFQELLLHFHALFAVFVIPLLLLFLLVLVAFPEYPEQHPGGWFLSARGRRMAILAAAGGILFMPAFVLVDEFLVGPGGWLPVSSPVIGNGLVPFSVMVSFTWGFSHLLKRLFVASREEAVQTLFVFLVMGFLLLTVIGIWFRGPGMALVWPWQM
jgi:quinol-cytochrome oxidoreductase complex cytochrome b subunit